MQSILDVPAPAKLNLFLHVLGRRPDGYHLLQSAFVLIDWCDTLHFEKRSDGQLKRHDLGTPLPEDDLCLRAARALQAASNTAWGCDISIAKQLPSGAGLGGGSSDAATTLLALNRLWGLNWSRAQLQKLALPLGADVPFFVAGHNALAEGVGELLRPLVLPERRVAVVKPPCEVPTRVIFNSPHLVRDNQPAILSGFLAAPDLLFQGFGRNDLQAVAQAEFPQVAQAVQLLHQLFGNSRMTGSGSAVFAILETPPEEAVAGRKNWELRLDQGAATTARAALSGVLPANWVSRVCRSLPQHPLLGWAAD